MIFLLSYTDDDFGGRINEQLLPYVADSSFEDYFVCFRFSTGKTNYADVYKRTRTLGSELPSVTKVISSKISSLKFLQITGPTPFDRNLFSKLMASADYIVSTMHRHSTTPKSITLLKGMHQIGNTNVKLMELEMNSSGLYDDLLPPELGEVNSEQSDREWNVYYLPGAFSNRQDYSSCFVDLPKDETANDISRAFDWLRSLRPVGQLAGPSIDQKRDLRDAGRELVPLVAELQAIKSKYQSDDVADMQVNEGYKSIEQIWRRIWFGHTSQNPTQSNQYGPRLR